MSTRGDHLLRADRRFATGELSLLKPLAPVFKSLLDKIDAGLLAGGMDVTLPGGGRRRLGFRTEGPIAVIRLNSWRAILRLATSGSVGWYKACEVGEWDSPDPVQIFDLFMRNGRALGNIGRAKGLFRLANRAAHAVRKNTPLGARKNIQAHYDLGNDFYSAWLDRSMTYSSAVFAEGDSLEEAQSRKIHLLLDRLKLKRGQRLLEIGCGWGSLAEVAARDYGVKVVGLTLSEEQKAYADQRMKKARLAGQVEIRLADYRELDESFDAVASVEMVEAVGREYWDDYMAAIGRSLSSGGRAALQLISIDPDLWDGYVASPDFIQTYIFPGGILINEPIFATTAGSHGLSWEDRCGYGQHYADTLKLWRKRYDAAVKAGKLDSFGEEFHRLWRYYLMYCEGGFRGGGIDVAQVTMVKG